MCPWENDKHVEIIRVGVVEFDLGGVERQRRGREREKQG